jgi:hypothetical protein
VYPPSAGAGDDTGESPVSDPTFTSHRPSVGDDENGRAVSGSAVTHTGGDASNAEQWTTSGVAHEAPVADPVEPNDPVGAGRRESSMEDSTPERVDDPATDGDIAPLEGGDWRLLHASATGTAHRAANLENQDSVAVYPPTGEWLPVVLVVSDGHGDTRHWRSATGARSATAAATEALREFVENVPANTTLTAVRRAALERLPRRLVALWSAAVYDHLERNAFSAGDLASLERSHGASVRAAVEAQPTIAYGATVVAVAITDRYLLALQLGDGDILIADRAGEISRPFPETAHGEDDSWTDTESLCGLDAWADVRVAVLDMVREAPALTLLSTDGLRKAFNDEDGYQQVVPDLVRTIRIQGVDQVRAALPDILARTSARSGDDVSVAVAIHASSLADPEWFSSASTRAPQPPDSEENAGTTTQEQVVQAVDDPGPGADLPNHDHAGRREGGDISRSHSSREPPGPPEPTAPSVTAAEELTTNSLDPVLDSPTDATAGPEVTPDRAFARPGVHGLEECPATPWLPPILDAPQVTAPRTDSTTAGISPAAELLSPREEPSAQTDPSSATSSAPSTSDVVRNQDPTQE